jgi:hypothetical protein
METFNLILIRKNAGIMLSGSYTNYNPWMYAYRIVCKINEIALHEYFYHQVKTISHVKKVALATVNFQVSTSREGVHLENSRIQRVLNDLQKAMWFCLAPHLPPPPPHLPSVSSTATHRKTEKETTCERGGGGGGRGGVIGRLEERSERCV